MREKDCISIVGRIRFSEIDRASGQVVVYPVIENRILNAAFRELPKLVAAQGTLAPYGSPITHCVIGKGGNGTHFVDATDDERIQLLDEFGSLYGGIVSVADPNWKFAQVNMSVVFTAYFNTGNELFSQYGAQTVNEIGLIIGDRTSQTSPPADRIFCAKDFAVTGPSITIHSQIILVVEYEIRFRREP